MRKKIRKSRQIVGQMSAHRVWLDGFTSVVARRVGIRLLKRVNSKLKNKLEFSKMYVQTRNISF